MNYIDQHKQYWGREFANLIGVEYRSEHDEIAAMGAFTMHERSLIGFWIEES